MRLCFATVSVCSGVALEPSLYIFESLTAEWALWVFTSTMESVVIMGFFALKACVMALRDGVSVLLQAKLRAVNEVIGQLQKDEFHLPRGIRKC
jgi:hypothetical protein